MAKKKRNEGTPGSPIPLGGGGTGPISGLGAMSPADRVAQVQALKEMSPFTALAPEVKVNVGKGFDLDQGAFNLRASTLERMNQTINSIAEKNRFKIFGQHVEGITYFKDGQERPRHNIAQANTKLLSIDQALGLQGGAYDKAHRFNPPKKGVVE